MSVLLCGILSHRRRGLSQRRIAQRRVRELECLPWRRSTHPLPTMFPRRRGPVCQPARADVIARRAAGSRSRRTKCCGAWRASRKALGENSASSRATAWGCSRRTAPNGTSRISRFTAWARVTVPIYFNESIERLTYILNDSGARVVFTSGEEQARKIAECRRHLPELEQVISVAPPADLHGESPALRDVDRDSGRRGDRRSIAAARRRCSRSSSRRSFTRRAPRASPRA